MQILVFLIKYFHDEYNMISKVHLLIVLSGININAFCLRVPAICNSVRYTLDIMGHISVNSLHEVDIRNNSSKLFPNIN